MFKQFVLAGDGFNLPRAAGAFMPGFKPGTLKTQQGAQSLPHGVSAESLNTSIQPKPSLQSLPSPPATPVAKANAFTPPTSVCKRLEAFHITSPPTHRETLRAAKTDDLNETICDSPEEPLGSKPTIEYLPDNQLGLYPDGSIPSPAASEVEQKQPLETPTPVETKERKDTNSTQQGHKSEEAQNGQPLQQPAQTERPNKSSKYDDGTYWKPCP